MSQLLKLSAALATTSVFALSVAGAHAAVVIPKPVVHIAIAKPAVQVAVPKPAVHIAVPRPAMQIAVPKPAVQIAVPKPAMQIAVPKPAMQIAVPKPAMQIAVPKPAMAAIRPPVVTKPTLIAQPVTVKGTPSSWQGPAGAGKQTNSMIYLNGKPVGATSAIAITAPKPGAPSAVPASMKPIVPGTVPVAKPTASAAATPVAAPVATKPAAAAPAAAPAKPKVTFTPVKYVAFKDQYGAVKGYYDATGKLVMGMTGPSGGNCSVTTAYQVLGGGGGLNATYTPGSTLVTAVQCYTR